jgi:hypothetical protein
VNHVDSGIHCKINFNVVVGDVENIHDTFGVAWNMPKTWFIWQVCFGKKTKKSIENVTRNTWGQHFVMDSETWFFCCSSRQQTSLPWMKNQTLEVRCTLVTTNIKEVKLTFRWVESLSCFLLLFVKRGWGGVH